MVSKLALVGGLAVTLAVGLAIAQTPFGGDDTGFVPPDKDTAKCENGVGKAAGKLAGCILKCHKKRADQKLATEADEDNCESNLPASADCKSKYNTTTGTLTTCPPCLNGAGIATVRDLVEFLIDQNNSKIYCQGTTPWGGDDTGNIPPDKATAKCEDTVGKAAGKAIACIIKCHKSRASGKFTSDAEEDACESGASPKSCASKYTAAVAKGCPVCGLTFSFIESQVDGSNGLVYCASPSGAFLN